MPDASAPSVPNRDLSILAPRFERALGRLLHGMWLAGLDPIVYEAFRSNARQQWLYAQGRTRPGSVVTNAADAMHGWHFFGVAADLISRESEWNYSSKWMATLSDLCDVHGLAWGGSWVSFKDYPHVQWSGMPSSPTDQHRAAYETATAMTGDPYDGRVAVWKLAGAV